SLFWKGTGVFFGGAGHAPRSERACSVPGPEFRCRLSCFVDRLLRSRFCTSSFCSRQDGWFASALDDDPKPGQSRDRRSMFVARRSALASAAAAEIACCEGRTPPFDRAWIATVLTPQTVGGAILGIAAQAV